MSWAVPCYSQAVFSSGAPAGWAPRAERAEGHGAGEAGPLAPGGAGDESGLCLSIQSNRKTKTCGFAAPVRGGGSLQLLSGQSWTGGSTSTHTCPHTSHRGVRQAPGRVQGATALKAASTCGHLTEALLRHVVRS